MTKRISCSSKVNWGLGLYVDVAFVILFLGKLHISYTRKETRDLLDDINGHRQ